MIHQTVHFQVKRKIHVLIEKPFGSNYERYLEYKNEAFKYINSCDFKLIDHYLGKTSIRTLNCINDVYDANDLKYIKINILEKCGVDHRLSYFNDVGLINDMFQSHILSIIFKLIGNKYEFLSTKYDNISNYKIGQYYNYTGDKDVETYFKLVIFSIELSVLDTFKCMIILGVYFSIS